MPPTSTFPLVDRIIGGDLAERLLEWRSQDPKLSWEGIARTIRDETGVTVSMSTVKRWYEDLEDAA